MPTTPRDRLLEDGGISMLVTKYQADEVDYGLDIDASDGNPDWGYLVRAGRAGWRLFIRPGT